MSLVLCVNEDDKIIGSMEKLKAHQLGQLHRAFSVFIFQDNDSRTLLLHRRALTKYHSPGLWTNACCGHPIGVKGITEEAQQRLKEEMGFSADLQCISSFLYKANVGGGLIEHEYDHIFVGYTSRRMFAPNPIEVCEWRWCRIDTILKELEYSKGNYTPWFPKALEHIFTQHEAALCK